MPVAYDNHSRTEGDLVATLSSGAFTISGADRVMVILSSSDEGVGINTPTASTGTPAAVTNAAVTTGVKRVAVHQVTAPATGSQSATAQFANADGTGLMCGAVSFTGADQTTPCQNGNNATGTSNAPSVTVASVAADDFVIDVCNHGGIGASGGAGAGQTERGTITDGYAGISTQDGADGGVMSWTSTESIAWVSAACRIVASAGEPGPDLTATPGEPIVSRATF